MKGRGFNGGHSRAPSFEALCKQCWNSVTAVVLTLFVSPLSNKPLEEDFSIVCRIFALSLCVFQRDIKEILCIFFGQNCFYYLVWIVQNFHSFNHSLISLFDKEVTAFQVNGSHLSYAASSFSQAIEKKIKNKRANVWPSSLWCKCQPFPQSNFCN